MRLRLSDFDAVTFDVYGTLIDWEPSIIAFLGAWAGRHGVSAPGKDLLMAFDRARADIQKERPAHLYPDILRRCFERVSREFSIAIDVEERERFAATPHAWPAYADSQVGLKALQAKAKVGALSNIDNASLASSCIKLGFSFDVVVTAERVGAYKPDWPHFHTGIADFAALGIPRQRILHIGQSLRADVTPANRLGLPCAWINRPGRLLGLSGEGAAEAKPDLTVSSLVELVAALTGAPADIT
ncbi:HAD family hydrolase [Phreatobacter stygius]|uniref:Haloacid dehalogenase n=1 Tax=Phreatobacter stygius TaxID=1940610 RepID=A0A4D7B7Y5_9HYPH|nr:HAD family hydrolase [Phreatobacter stygius]QCI67085.1 haloacid dehalogenase [Phreatobacter stygius]